MKRIDFYLDFVSPYAYLAFEALPQALVGISHQVAYKPVLLGAMLRQHGLLGPAEVPAKREWLYRHVQWLAHQQGVPLRIPAQHPFTSLDLLRLALACGPGPTPNRHVCETLFRHVWHEGADATDATRMAALVAQLSPQRDPAGAEPRAALRALTDAAVAQGVFGVPAFTVDGHWFWGLDALPMLRAYLLGDAWFAQRHAEDAAPAPGITPPG
jgi:2-hydroxychromene-2-carboxylate isomerase